MYIYPIPFQYDMNIILLPYKTSQKMPKNIYFAGVQHVNVQYNVSQKLKDAAKVQILKLTAR